MSPGNDRRRPVGRTASNGVNLNSRSLSCCGDMSADEIAECSRRGIYCGPDKCARRQLDIANVDNALRCAELRARAQSYDAVAAFDDFACWLRAQLLDFADLLEAGER